VAFLDQREIEQILKEHKNIAIVGLSRNTEKDSYRVGAYLKKHGFQIIPVNPLAEEVLGEKSYRSLLDVPVEIQKVIDIVDIFRRSEDVPPIVEQAIALKAKHGKPNVVWMQLGITNEKAAKAAERAGLAVVMNKCIMIEHAHLS
jgi:predicted CoA-binding protein